MDDAPAEVWLRPSGLGNYWRTRFPDDLDAVRYVRADLYEALQERLRIVRSWGEAPCLDPLGHDIR